MIRGVVNARREAIVQLRLRGPAGTELLVDALVDTGFTGSLSLPPAVITALGLPLRSSGRFALADGSVQNFDIYTAGIAWGGRWRSVEASALGAEALLGMRLLARHEVAIEVVPGGVVQIIPLP